MVFCHTSTRISHRYTHVPSLPNLPPVSLPNILIFSKLFLPASVLSFLEPVAHLYFWSLVSVLPLIGSGITTTQKPSWWNISWNGEGEEVRWEMLRRQKQNSLWLLKEWRKFANTVINNFSPFPFITPLWSLEEQNLYSFKSPLYPHFLEHSSCSSLMHE